MRGATRQGQNIHTTSINFNPRPPCGERPVNSSYLFAMSSYFNPRPPCGERLIGLFKFNKLALISIHAPHAGSDSKTAKCACPVDYFNPRPPCGERHEPAPSSRARYCISIHAPHAGSDHELGGGEYAAHRISIHAPHAGSDSAVAAVERRFSISIHAPHAGSDTIFRGKCQE